MLWQPEEEDEASTRKRRVLGFLGFIKKEKEEKHGNHGHLRFCDVSSEEGEGWTE